jgi:methionine synthase II (cobalamin-independent)
VNLAARAEVVGSLPRPAVLKDTFAARHATRPVKPTLPSPSYAAELYIADVSESACAPVPLLAEIVRELLDAGFRYIQLDCPPYSTLVVPETRDRTRRVGQMIAYDNRLTDAFLDEEAQRRKVEAVARVAQTVWGG